ncbi:hypothetical protein [Bacillus phage Chedec 11]|uniref:Uncharacterized protein n=1 Tax=Bacillus phage Chedec 11 TaxID=2932672 RepID=A0A976N0I6_9CAUD|nr:hypothetical protein [Bacillus phage Chedec 11]
MKFEIEDLGRMIIVRNNLNDEVCYLPYLHGNTIHLQRSSAVLLDRKVGATGTFGRWVVLDWYTFLKKDIAMKRLKMIDKYMRSQGYKLTTERKEVKRWRLS